MSVFETHPRACKTMVCIIMQIICFCDGSAKKIYTVMLITWAFWHLKSPKLDRLFKSLSWLIMNKPLKVCPFWPYVTGIQQWLVVSWNKGLQLWKVFPCQNSSHVQRTPVIVYDLAQNIQRLHWKYFLVKKVHCSLGNTVGSLMLPYRRQTLNR